MREERQQRLSFSSILMAALLCACLFCQYAVAPALADSAPQTVPTAAAPALVSEQILPNGLKLVLLEDHSYPVVSCLTWYRVGARNETVGCTGITHLLEHMLFGSVGSFRKGEIASSIARVGGQFNGYTSDDFTTFFETLPASKLELALKIESERMRKGTFSDKDLQEEIANIQMEFENESADASATLSREVRAMLYLTHPYHNPTMGWRTDVENLTAQQVKDYYDRYFWPDNCTMVIAGDIQPSAAAVLASKYFNVVPRAPHAIPAFRVTEPVQRGERRIVVKYPGKQEALQVAYHAPAFDDPDAPAMEVLQKLLNAQYAGRLRSHLVDGKLCASANAQFEAKKDPGYFAVTCTPAAGITNAQQKICEALDLMIAQLRAQPVSDVELRRARNLAELAFYTEQEGPYRAGFHLGYFDVLSKWQNTATFGERLRSVTAADVQRVAKRYLNADNRVVAWLSGTAAPHPAPTKPDVSPSPARPTGPHPMEHARLTGYKTDDNALAPHSRHGSGGREPAFVPHCSGGRQPADGTFKYFISQEAPPLAVERDTLSGKVSDTKSVKPPDTTKSTPIDSAADTKPSNGCAVQRAIKDIPKALPAAVKVLPAAIGGAPGAIKELPTAVEKVPTVIKSIPSAVSGLPGVIKELPSAVGSVPGAIKQLPGAIGGLPGAAASAVKELPGAIVGLPGTAASTLKELPGTLTAIPGAAASALRAMPSALGSFAVQVGTLPVSIVKPASRLDGMPVFHKTLKNGINLVVFPTRLAPIVQVQGAVQAGDAYDPSGKSGLSQLVTAMLNQGTSKRSHIQILTQQEDAGLVPAEMLHFRATEDSVRFSTRSLARDLPIQLDLIAETLMSPAAADSDVDKDRQDVLTAFKQGEDSGQDKAGRALLRSLLATSSPFLPEEPWEVIRNLANLTAADTHKFLSDHVVPSATTIVIAGDVDPEQAFQMTEHAFGTWAAKGAHQRLRVHPNVHHVVRTSVPSRDKSQTLIGFGQLLPITRSGAEFGNLLIADAIISNHPIVSRINKVLAAQPQLAHALNDEPVETDIKPLSNALAWSFVVPVEPNAVPAVVQTIQQQLKDLSSTGITADELSEMKRYLLGALPVRSMSTVSGIADTLLETCIHADEGEGVFNEMNSVRAATVDSVNKTIRNVLKPDQATLVIVGSSQSIRSVRTQVLSESTTVDASVVGAIHSSPLQEPAAQP